MNSTAPRRIIIAASGTGGHLVPALHIARALREREANCVVEFIGSGRPLETKLIDGAGYVRHEIKTVGLKHRGAKGLIQFLLGLPSAACAVWRLFSIFKPDLVIGVGGYVTFLPVTIAKLRGIPTWIHEAELRPGLANHVLSYYATRVSTAFKEAKMPWMARVVYTGHPLRKELQEFVKLTSEIRPPQNVLITGGSQGAQGIDKGMLDLMDVLQQHKLEVYHQCRAENLDELEAAYEKAGVKARVVTFIDDMVEAYRWGDIFISRAGAASLMELSVVNKPVIFVPYPHAQGDHQTANAKTMSDHGKALLVQEGEKFSERLRSALLSLFQNDLYKTMREQSYEGRAVDGAERIAEMSLALIR